VLPQRENRVVPIDLPAARLTPLAKRVAQEHQLDPAVFAPGMLIRKDDILRHLGLLPAESQAARKMPTWQREGNAAPAAVPGVPLEWKDMPRRKSVEAKVLGLGRDRSIQSSVTAACRAPGLRARMERLGFGAVGSTALIVYETARLLRKYPAFNAVHDAGRVGEYGKVNIGWAVDGGLGLVVPVIPDADQKTVPEIAATLQKQTEAYVENALTPADFLGGTFTVSDLTSAGVAFFQPLISNGQSAILGIGSDPGDGRGETLYFTLAFDHQVTEGRAAALFLKDLAERIAVHGAAGTSAEPQYCLMCQRDAGTLRRLKAVLLRSEAPPGMICSICILG
jgi:pyruvate dehydrogenase E2 component (dihydrolipoamide acetyltransferase)